MCRVAVVHRALTGRLQQTHENSWGASADSGHGAAHRTAEYSKHTILLKYYFQKYDNHATSQEYQRKTRALRSANLHGFAQFGNGHAFQLTSHGQVFDSPVLATGQQQSSIQGNCNR